MAPMAAFTTTDTCGRCGLRRLTKALEDTGTVIRLCDDCYWGQESAAEEPVQFVRLTAAGIHKLLTPIASGRRVA